MKKSVILMLLFALLAVLLVACNNAEEKVVNQPQKEEGEMKEEPSSYPLTYTDAIGKEVVIEKEPQRVISLMHVLYPDVLLALDTKPVGIANADTMFNLWEAYQSFTKEQKFADIGDVKSPSLEKIVELKPDLILAASGVHDQLYDQLSAIAPVVYLNQRAMSTDQELAVTEISKVLGKEEQGKALLEEVSKKITDSREALKNFTAKGETVVFTSVNTKEGFWIYGKNIAPTNSENGLGIKVPENYPEDITKEVSMEGMSVLNPEHLFIFLDKSGITISEDEFLKSYEESAVWKNINAVKNGNIYIVDRSLFAQDAPIATMYGIDVVVDILKDK
ncbi:iron-siderophore ABC transporter substrate-binding protein [Lysinibacillus cavernae]|uniref:iron-siderophore ABC transporter substrate-binding protein n=1 Tax=Lysinibacillus cavernae TaxID=2666135 RepID=UPI0018C1FDC2|nr:iron-siderophore ABC transporter substrate-binding protein [Lysinibacillus cavernae]